MEQIIEVHDFSTELTSPGRIIRCPNELPTSKQQWYVFLAGPIQGAPEWQNSIDMIPGVTFLSPRRVSYDNFNYNEQVNWETEAMRTADVILFWIPEEAEHIEGRGYAQTTRTEFGEYIAMGKKVIIGIYDKFPGRRYFASKCKQYGITELHDSLQGVIGELKAYINECNRRKLEEKIFVTSDTHFGSKRTLELSRRPFRNVDDMDWRLVENWNRVVHPGDKVFHLGDFGDTKWVRYLNGDITLLYGNYERKDIADGKLIKEDLRVFRKAYDKKYLPVAIEDDLYIMSHEPLNGIGGRTDYIEDKPMVLYGHIHARQKIKPFGTDVGVDGANYTPMSLADVRFFQNALDKGYYDEEVWC